MKQNRILKLKRSKIRILAVLVILGFSFGLRKKNVFRSDDYRIIGFLTDSLVSNTNAYKGNIYLSSNKTNGEKIRATIEPKDCSKIKNIGDLANDFLSINKLNFYFCIDSISKYTNNRVMYKKSKKTLYPLIEFNKPQEIKTNEGLFYVITFKFMQSPLEGNTSICYIQSLPSNKFKIICRRLLVNY